MKRYYDLVRHDPLWSKILSYFLVIFFIRLADSLVSFWAPSLLQHSFDNSFTTGLIISFQSIVGLGADLVFPILLKKGTVKKLTVYTILMSAGAFIFFYISGLRPLVVFFLISMTIWGIYYELAGFSVFQFMDNTVPPELRSGGWGVLDIFVSLAYFLGPLIAVWLLVKGNTLIVIFGLILLFTAFLLLSFKNKMQDRPLEATFDGIKPWHEVGYWATLLKTIWPLIVITFITGFIDSTFWTTGVIWTVKLTRINPAGSLLLSLYTLPSLFMGLLVARWKVYHGKKRLALKFLVLSGLFLTGIFISNSVYWILLMILTASMSLSIVAPLITGVYSDIIGRLGKERKHLIGLTGGVVNLSYIIWPPIAGLISNKVGEKMTFVIMGAITLILSIILFFVMPRKLKLPQDEISAWEN